MYAADMPEQPLYSIGLFESSTKNKDTQLNVHVSDKHFKIDLFAANFEDSRDLLDEYLRHVEHADPEYIPEEDENGDFADPLDEMNEWVLKPFLPIFRDIPPLDPDRRYTLGDCLYADELHYTVKAVGGNMIPVLLGKTERKKNHIVGAQLPSSTHVDYSMFPVYHPNEIQVPIDDNANSLPGIPRKVFIQGRSEPSFFKMVYGSDQRITLRELSAYSKIHAANFAADDLVRTSRLHGLVQDDQKHVMGLLLSYINSDGATLFCVDGCDPKYSEIRHKWLDQISQTLKHLHAHKIVWGDAKAANVLLDANEDAYLIDFGGGYTEGWVTKENSNSIEGDIEGLESIRRYLFDEPLS